MRVLTCSRHFPKGHPKAGQPTGFVEKILYDLVNRKVYSKSKAVEMARAIGIEERHPMYYIDTFSWYDCMMPKGHTIRAGSRWKVGDMISLRVWSDKPYRSKQIEFAQVEVKKVWSIEINVVQTSPVIQIESKLLTYEAGKELAANDGLSLTDFISWFSIHPKKKQQTFTGQIISWSSAIEYTPSTLTEKMEG